MADAIVSVVLEQLTSFTVQEIKSGVSLVVGASKAVKSLTSTLQTIQAVLKDAEKRQVKEEAVRVWLYKLKEAAYDMDDVLDEWNTSTRKLQIERAEVALTPMKKVCSFFLSPSFCLRQVAFRCRIACKIKEINERLDVIAKEKEMYSFNTSSGSIEQPQLRVKTTSFVDVSKLFGRDEEKNKVLSKLLSQNSDEQKCFHVISILGMGGIGKTSLAQLVYNSNEVSNNFHKRIWVCVSDPFDEFKVAKAVIEALTGYACNLGELQSIFEDISKHIVGKKFLLVLDDVWSEDPNKWEPLYNCLKNCLHGSKILVTTRKETVARLMNSNDIISVEELHEQECWSLFKCLAFLDKSPEECEKLEGVGREIVGKCKGLPLAIKIIGSLLRFKKTRDEWQSVLDNYETWKLEKFEEDLFPTLLLSYNDLPLMVRRCFSFCAIFPKDYNINKDQLIQLWMAQGYLSFGQNNEMEITGQEYFDILAMRSFFQDFEKDEYDEDDIISFKMHDIIHDFAQFLTKNECFAIEEVNIYEEACPFNSSYEKAHHAMLLGLKVSLSLISSLCNIKKLRSLLFDESTLTLDSFTLSLLFNKLTYLRALGFGGNSFSHIQKYPKEIGKLVHLRYLKLYRIGDLQELPETLCGLCNLQTLDISVCYQFHKLPENIGKLVNLRHLITNDTGINYMPKGMEKLTCLRTLKGYVASGSDDHDTKACSLECLKNFSNLRSLRINQLGCVTDVNEVKRAELNKMRYLLSLELYFEEFFINAGRRDENDKVILESFQLPSNLEKLEIFNCGGSTLSQDWLLSLTTVRVLKLTCGALEHLPPLGKLPSLEILIIDHAVQVERVGGEFLGIGSDDTSFIAFPRLRSLTFQGMWNFEEWEYEITNERKENIRIMPSLRNLKIEYCDQLKTIPENLLQSATIEKLQIVGCPILQQRCQKGTGDYWPKISHIPDIHVVF